MIQKISQTTLISYPGEQAVAVADHGSELISPGNSVRTILAKQRLAVPFNGVTCALP
jgi:hypothetical protein